MYNVPWPWIWEISKPSFSLKMTTPYCRSKASLKQIRNMSTISKIFDRYRGFVEKVNEVDLFVTATLSLLSFRRSGSLDY